MLQLLLRQRPTLSPRTLATGRDHLYTCTERWHTLCMSVRCTEAHMLPAWCTAVLPMQAFGNGVHAFAEHLLDPDFLHAVKLTLMVRHMLKP